MTNYIWCDGARPCQARNGANAVTRTYLDEGEYVPGSPGTALYYGIDQIGSVRRVFSGSGNPAYGYDPYGIPLDATPRVADIGYAGMLTEADSGLSLTPYRAYDANAGRWLSRDPLGESVPEGVNLYQYVLGNPVAFTDPFGLKCDPNPRWPGAGGPGGQPRGGNGGGGTGSPGPQNNNNCSGPLRRPSSSMMNEATNDALSDTNSGATTSPLTSEFSKLNGSPDFSRGWTPVTNIHGATSYEQPIPGGSGMVVKVYIGDRNFGGANTVTITSPTYSIDHVIGVLPYELGLPVNARNAAVYLSSRSGC